MPKIKDKAFETKRSFQGRFKQYGAFSYQSPYNRPLTSRLQLYEKIAMLDPLVEACLDAVCSEVVSTIGEPEHEDPEISSFLRDMVQRMQYNRGHSIHDTLYHMLKTELWGGFKVTEPSFEIWDGMLIDTDMMTYHPSSIIIVPDRKGRLNEGRQSFDGTRTSGIYQQPIHTRPEVKIPLRKAMYTSHQSRFGNYYGRSIISSIYKWHRLKETLIDQMVIALDRFGNPLLWMKVPGRSTGRTKVDPQSGEEYNVSAQEEAQEQLQDLQGDGNVIVLTQNDSDISPEVGTLTTGNDVGTSFLEAISYASEQIAMGLYPPYFLVSDRSKITNDTLIERRVDQFKNLVSSKRDQLVKTFSTKVLWEVVKWNFNRESAKVPPTMSYIQSSRQEQLVDKMQAVKGLTEDGYINPSNEGDWQMVRQMINATPRKMSNRDVTFVKEMLINPKKEKSNDSQRSSTTNAKTKETNPNRGNSNKNGRPTGQTTKQQNPRSVVN